MNSFKFFHRWLGILASVFILLFALSGIVLNHRGLFSGVDIPRKYLPKKYHFQNWNLAAVKSATRIGHDSILLYGNIGIWLTNDDFSLYEPHIAGLRRGTDNRRTSVILRTGRGAIIAGTNSGLYFLKGNRWEPISLPVKEKRIAGITEFGGNIWVLTRSHLLTMDDAGEYIPEAIHLPHPAGYRRETSMFRALWVIHSGEILGFPGKIFVDILGLILAVLCLTGIIWFIAPDMIRALRKKTQIKKRMARMNRVSYKWHKKLGIYVFAFLIVSAATGMFLRPPLLIPIVRKTFPAIKNTILDHPNPWHDKLRDIRYDHHAGLFLFSTSEGFYYADVDFRDSLQPVWPQPPISVMGINVFEQQSDGVFITGSFSGIHLWQPSEKSVHDLVTGLPVQPARGMSNPFGAVAVAGFIKLDDINEFIFDYDGGLFSRNRNAVLPQMPECIKQQARLPLWNLALEIHTGRFYSLFLGKWYILFVPVMGLILMIILVSGTIVWLKQWWRRRQKRAACSGN